MTSTYNNTYIYTYSSHFLQIFAAMPDHGAIARADQLCNEHMVSVLGSDLLRMCVECGFVYFN